MHAKPAPRVRFAPRWLLVAAALFFATLVAIVARSLVRPRLATFAPTLPRIEPAGDSLVRDTVTIDSRDPEAWTFFDFSRRSVVHDPGPLEWDLAIRRYRIIVNGGDALAGRGGAAALERPWEAVHDAPSEGYAVSVGDLDREPSNPALERWYRYDFLAHTLEPRPRTYAVRTADGKYAKLRILGYYCPQATPGCLTFEYAYQGDGSRRLTPPASASPP